MTCRSLIAGDLTDATNANAAIALVDTALGTINADRATYGAGINQLTHAVDNLTNVKVNSEASRSRILDTDYAEATSELARTQIIQHMGTAMFAQANQLLKQCLRFFSKLKVCFVVSKVSVRMMGTRLFAYAAGRRSLVEGLNYDGKCWFKC